MKSIPGGERNGWINIMSSNHSFDAGWMGRPRKKTSERLLDDEIATDHDLKTFGIAGTANIRFPWKLHKNMNLSPNS